jgi:hypothetical protein
MVFHAVSETTETPPAPAQPPAIVSSACSQKPQAQPLHGFAFSDFKWPVNHSTTNHHHRFRNRLADSEPRPKYSPVVNEDHHHHHRRVVRKLAESTRSADSEPVLGSPLKNDHHQVSKLGGSTRKEFGSENRNDPVCDGVNKPGFPEPPKENSEKKSTNPVRVIEKSTASDVKSKIFIRIRTKSKSDADAGDDGAAEATDQTISAAAAPDSDEPAPKTWNLRPRKPAPKRPNADGGAPEAVGAPAQDTKTQPLGHAEPSRARNGTDTKVSKKRPRLSISLSKEEIEEDVFVFTGSKPARRPKKRPRNVQKQLDVINLQAQDFAFFSLFLIIL